MQLPDLAHKLFAFFTNSCFAFCIPKIRRMGRVDALYITGKKLILYVKPFFLLSEFVESRCNVLRCQRCCICCHKAFFNWTICYLIRFPAFSVSLARICRSKRSMPAALRSHLSSAYNTVPGQCSG